MFIPVSLASGSTFVDCTISATGVLVAECQTTYEGQTYSAGTEIPVEWGDTVRLTTTVTQYAEIPVVLNGKTFLWFVSLPKTLRYVNDLAYKRLTGTVYGKLYKHPSNEQTLYATTGSFVAGDAVASVDYVKKEIWFFNTLDQVKKLTVADKPVAVVFAPRWSLAEGVETTCFVVTEAQIHRLTATFDIAESWALASAPSCASSDVNGNIVLCYADTTRIDVWQNGTVQYTNTSGQLSGVHSIFVTPDNNYIVGCNAGVVLITLNAGTFAYEVMASRTGLYFNFDLNAEFLYAVDAANRCVVSIALSDRTYNAVYFDFVPRDVVVHEDDVYVSFLNQTKTLKYDKTLATHTEFTTVKSYGSAFLDEFTITDLYSNAADVTLAEPAAPEAVQIIELEVGEEYEHSWTVDWPRPEYVRLGTTEATVTVNEMAFTEGYLRAGDVVKVVMPASPDYYLSRYVKLIGRRVVSFNLRTEPKLFPNPVTLPQVNEAFIKQQYADQFTVAGLTEGFSVAIVATTPELTFSINGGAPVASGTVRNGDVVDTFVTIKNLITKRNNHDILTAAEHPVALWTVLVLVLSGVEVRRDVVQAKAKWDTIVYEPTFAHKMTFVGDVWPVNGPLAFEGYDALNLHNTVVRADLVNSEDVLRHHAWYASGDGEVCPSTTSLIGTQEHELMPSTRFVVGNSTHEFGPRAHTSTHEHSTALTDVSRFAFGHTENKRMPTGTTHAETAVTLRATFAAWTASFPYYETITTSPTALSIGGVWQFKFLNLPMYDVAMEYSKVAPSLIGDVQMDYSKVNPTPMVDVTLGHVLAESPTYGILNAVPSLALSPTFGILDMLPLLTPSPTYGLQDAEALWANSPTYGESTLVPLLAGSSKRLHSAAQEGTRRGLDNQQMVPSNVVELASYRRVAVDASPPMFVRNTQVEHVMDGADSGFFNTQAEAVTYALTLNLDVNTPAQYFQLGGKWVFVSAPVADNAVCVPTTLPPDQQKRFGYVGGG